MRCSIARLLHWSARRGEGGLILNPMAEESAKAHPQHEDLVLPEPPPRRAVPGPAPPPPAGPGGRWGAGGVGGGGAGGMRRAEPPASRGGAVARGVSEQRQMPVGGRLGEG